MLALVKQWLCISSRWSNYSDHRHNKRSLGFVESVPDECSLARSFKGGQLMTQPCSHWYSLNKVICLLQTIHLVSIKHQQSTTVIAMSIRRNFSRGGKTIYTIEKVNHFWSAIAEHALNILFFCRRFDVIIVEFQVGFLPPCPPAPRRRQWRQACGWAVDWYTRTGGTTLHYCVWQKVMDDDEAITSYKHQHYCPDFFIWFTKPHQQ